MNDTTPTPSPTDGAESCDACGSASTDPGYWDRHDSENCWAASDDGPAVTAAPVGATRCWLARRDDDGQEPGWPPADHDGGEIVTCGQCGAQWCGQCDPAPAAMCHYCNGRGSSTAEVFPPERDPNEGPWIDPDGNLAGWSCVSPWNESAVRAKVREVTAWTEEVVASVTDGALAARVGGHIEAARNGAGRATHGPSGWEGLELAARIAANGARMVLTAVTWGDYSGADLLTAADRLEDDVAEVLTDARRDLAGHLANDNLPVSAVADAASEFAIMVENCHVGADADTARGHVADFRQAVAEGDYAAAYRARDDAARVLFAAADEWGLNVSHVLAVPVSSRPSLPGGAE